MSAIAYGKMPLLLLMGFSATEGIHVLLDGANVSRSLTPEARQRVYHCHCAHAHTQEEKKTDMLPN